MANSACHPHTFIAANFEQAALKRCQEDLKAAKEKSEAAAQASSLRIGVLEQDKARLGVQAEQAEVLLARCSRLEVSLCDLRERE